MSSFEQPPPPKEEKEEKKSVSPEEELMQRRITEQEETGEEVSNMSKQFLNVQQELFEQTMKTLEKIAAIRGGKDKGGEVAKATNEMSDNFNKAREELEKELKSSQLETQKRIEEIERELKDAKPQTKTPEERLRESLKSMGDMGDRAAFDVYWIAMLPKLSQGEDVKGFAPELQQKIKKLHEQAEERIFSDPKGFQIEFDELKKEAFQSWLAGKEKK